MCAWTRRLSGPVRVGFTKLMLSPCSMRCAMLKMHRFKFMTWRSTVAVLPFSSWSLSQPSSMGCNVTPLSVAHHSSVQSWNKRVVSREVRHCTRDS